MTFARRAITVTITLGGGAKGETVTGTYKLEGYRVECAIVNHGGYSMGNLQCRIYGLKQSQINHLTSTGIILNSRIAANSIRIDAGNEGSQLTTVYDGNIKWSWGDFQAAPDVCLNVLAFTGGGYQVKPAPIYSTTGNTSAAEAFKHLANLAGFGFVNEGVNVTLPPLYLTGSVLDQIKQLRETVRCNAELQGRNILYIWPLNGHVSEYMPIISPDSNMVGYPSFSSSRIDVRTEFMPRVLVGSHVQIDNDMLGATVNGVWQVKAVSHNIACQAPNGPWFTNLSLFRSPT